jgi:hypothetical protein
MQPDTDHVVRREVGAATLATKQSPIPTDLSRRGSSSPTAGKWQRLGGANDQIAEYSLVKRSNLLAKCGRRIVIIAPLAGDLVHQELDHQARRLRATAQRI